MSKNHSILFFCIGMATTLVASPGFPVIHANPHRCEIDRERLSQQYQQLLAQQVVNPVIVQAQPIEQGNEYAHASVYLRAVLRRVQWCAAAMVALGATSYTAFQFAEEDYLILPEVAMASAGVGLGMLGTATAARRWLPKQPSEIVETNP